MFCNTDNMAINAYKGKYLLGEVKEKKQYATEVGSHHQLTTRGIAHDINNMLSIVTGYLDLVLSNDELSSGDRNNLEKAFQASEILGELTSLLLKGDNNKRCRSLQSLIGLIEDTVEVILGMDDKYTWYISYAPDTGLLYVPCLHLKRIIQNLVKNSKEAMPKGGHLSISIKNVTLEENLPNGHQPGRYVQISLRDEGIGISGERIADLFHSGLTTKENGNGLGLKITNYLTQLNNGFINASSSPGYGTLFNLYFPLN